MKYSLLTGMIVFFVISIFAPQLIAQDTLGFVDQRINALNPRIEWRENWFSGDWFNFSFNDNFSLAFAYYDVVSPNIDRRVCRNSGLLAAMGNMSTSRNGPQFWLFGYVVEDETWCIIPSVLSPEYIHRVVWGQGEYYFVNEAWNFSQVIFEGDPPFYQYDLTWLNHSYNIWGRLPPGKTIQLYWGADYFVGWDFYWHNGVSQGRDIRIGFPNAFGGSTYYATLGAYMNSGSGMWQYLGEYNAGGPAPPPNEEPPGWAKCTFQGWLKPDLTDGKDWLPEPGSVIGLVFKFERDDVPAMVTIRYNVNRISTWQGECMNYPVGADKPVPTGEGDFFDFSIVDTAKYDIVIHDYDTYEGHQMAMRPENAGETFSIRRYVLSLELEFPALLDSTYDTLWLKAHDYGAKAIVSPVTGQTWRDLMTMRTTEFGQDVWSVSVPRDDDGQASLGYNLGDFMADAWEEQVLGVNPGDSAVKNFVPFYQKDPDGNLVYADQDKDPTGRDIKGDRFCNWEEYRGFITAGDQYGYYTTDQHTRLNPFTKNALLHFMPSAECKPESPGWISALPDTMAYIVDFFVFDSIRLSQVKIVNYNKYGAYYPYYSARGFWADGGLNWGTTNKPAEGLYQSAVVIWPQYRGTNPLLTPPAGAMGVTRGWRIAFNDSCFVPELVNQLEVNVDFIEDIRIDLAYYNGAAKDSAWKADKAKLIKFVLAHEIGHSIGMTHDILFNYIMEIRVLYDRNNQNKLILDPPGFTREYSNRSKDQISIKE